jgi:glycosyltransferase involved in cell wall biosynthesis
MPLVSVIIPTHNRAQLISRSTRSVLAQTYQDIEIIVVDDGSTDDTRQVVTSYGDRVSYIFQQRAGASAARNLGVLNSSGEYLMFLDSDDTIQATAIMKLARALDENPDCGAAFCGWNTVNERRSEVVGSSLDRPSGDVFVQMCTQHLCIGHSALVRRECLAKSGLFDPELPQYEDIDFWVRVAAHCRFKFVPEHLVNYHQGHTSSSGEPGRLAWSRDLILSKLSAYRKNGRLGPREWRAVYRRIRENYSNNCAIIAQRALDNGQYRRALAYSVLALAYRPNTIRRRGRLLPLLKALWFTLTRPFAGTNTVR